MRRLDQGINFEGRKPTLEVASLPIQRCMSSLRKSARVRQKSPPLQAPSVRPETSSKAGEKYRIDDCLSGMMTSLNPKRDGVGSSRHRA